VIDVGEEALEVEANYRGLAYVRTRVIR
jgi:hypothetical protein